MVLASVRSVLITSGLAVVAAVCVFAITLGWECRRIVRSTSSGHPAQPDGVELGVSSASLAPSADEQGRGLPDSPTSSGRGPALSRTATFDLRAAREAGK